MGLSFPTSPSDAWEQFKNQQKVDAFDNDVNGYTISTIGAPTELEEEVISKREQGLLVASDAELSRLQEAIDADPEIDVNVLHLSGQSWEFIHNYVFNQKVIPDEVIYDDILNGPLPQNARDFQEGDLAAYDINNDGIANMEELGQYFQDNSDITTAVHHDFAMMQKYDGWDWKYIHAAEFPDTSPYTSRYEDFTNGIWNAYDIALDTNPLTYANENGIIMTSDNSASINNEESNLQPVTSSTELPLNQLTIAPSQSILNEPIKNGIASQRELHLLEEDLQLPHGSLDQYVGENWETIHTDYTQQTGFWNPLSDNELEAFEEGDLTVFDRNPNPSQFNIVGYSGDNNGIADPHELKRLGNLYGGPLDQYYNWDWQYVHSALFENSPYNTRIQDFQQGVIDAYDIADNYVSTASPGVYPDVQKDGEASARELALLEQDLNLEAGALDQYLGTDWQTIHNDYTQQKGYWASDNVSSTLE